MTDIVNQHLKLVQRRYPDAEIITGKTYYCAFGDILFISKFELPLSIYNKNIINMCFCVPVGYPNACPNHFYVDDDLRLKHGGFLTFSRTLHFPINNRLMQEILIIPNEWNPNLDTLFNYTMLVKSRLSKGF